MKFVSLGPRAQEVRPKHTGSCHDCEAPLSGKFCSACGQSSHVHVASAGEFIHHFVGHYIAAEGKLWRTFADLLLRPGQLTIDFIRGRRTRHIDPLRLLLTVSLLVFASLKLQTYLTDGAERHQPATAEVQAKSKQDKPVTTRIAAQVFEQLSPRFRKNLQAFEALPSQEQARIVWNSWLKSGPTTILCLIPLVALFLKLLSAGGGWRYGEHLVFSIHLHAFVLLCFLAWMLLAGVAYTAAITLGCLALYVLLAMRRVYGGGVPVLALRWIGLLLLELKTFALMALIAFFITLL